MTLMNSVHLGTSDGRHWWLCGLPLAEVVVEVDLVLIEARVDAIGEHI